VSISNLVMSSGLHEVGENKNIENSETNVGMKESR
jgi:hypothetical protein